MEFSDYVNNMIEPVKDMEANAWLLCREAYKFKVEFDCKQGRPPKNEGGEEKPTFTDLAGALQVKTNTVSEWASMGEFYENVRPSDSLSYTHYRMAKKKAGKGNLDKALEYLKHAETQYLYKTQEFERFLKGIYWEGPVKVTDLFPAGQACVPEVEAYVWVVVSRYYKKDGEE